MTLLLNIEQLRHFVPQSPILAFTPSKTGSPMHDWCTHLERNPLRRQELEEFAILGDVVVRIADEIEAEPVDKVKILSLEYAMKVLGEETDAIEFVRCVKAIASPDAGQFEYQQIAAYYYGEIRRRGIPEVLKEMGLLGMEMAAVTTPVSERESDVIETRPVSTKFSRADKRRCWEAAQNRKPLPAPTTIFDEEMKAVLKRIGGQKITRMICDDFAEYYLSDGDKSMDELDRDYLTFENLEQYDENGVIGLRMNGGQSTVVAFDFEYEVDASYLPAEVRQLNSIIGNLFVGHQMGGEEVLRGRCLIKSSEQETFRRTALSDDERKAWQRPFSNQEFEKWIELVELEMRSDEVLYVKEICRILWYRLHKDFHIRSLRNEAYQTLYLGLRGTTDTADVADLKKKAYAAFKDRNELSLKEFTSLNTVAKSQESRLLDRIEPAARRWLRIIDLASPGQLRYRKFALYNEPEAKSFTRQEKQRLWDAVRSREVELKAEANTVQARHVQQHLFAQPAHVKVVPAA